MTRWLVLTLLVFIVACGAARPAPSSPADGRPPSARPPSGGPSVGSPSPTAPPAPAPPPVPITSEHCLHGCPLGAPTTNTLIRRPIYTLSNNPTTKFADWVAYQVREDALGGHGSRRWKTDPDLPPGTTLDPADFRGAYAALGTDRGHQAPLASFTGTGHWKLTNYLSNITPQKKGLNRGPWVELETAVRDLAKSGTVVFVMTGPVYARTMPPLPGTTKEHRVPSGYWKVVAVDDDDGLSSVAFFFDQDTPRNDDVCDHVQTVRALETTATLKFFENLDAAKQDTLETETAALAGALGCDDVEKPTG